MGSRKGQCHWHWSHNRRQHQALGIIIARAVREFRLRAGEELERVVGRSRALEGAGYAFLRHVIRVDRGDIQDRVVLKIVGAARLRQWRLVGVGAFGARSMPSPRCHRYCCRGWRCLARWKHIRRSRDSHRYRWRPRCQAADLVTVGTDIDSIAGISYAGDAITLALNVSLPCTTSPVDRPAMATPTPLPTMVFPGRRPARRPARPNLVLLRVDDVHADEPVPETGLKRSRDIRADVVAFHRVVV